MAEQATLNKTNDTNGMSIAAFILTILIVVTVHEYGHYQVARWCGVKILRFSIGMGKPLWKKTYGQDQTEFVIAMLPVGGYVRMLDERELEQNETIAAHALPRAFNRQAVWKRMLIVLAGPMANFLLAIVIFSALFTTGVMTVKPVIGKVATHSLAAQAGVKVGDEVLSVDGEAVNDWQKLGLNLIEKATEKKAVAVKVRDAAQQIRTYHLDLSQLSLENESQDMMQQLGIEVVRPVMPAKVGLVEKNSVAEKAGLQLGDTIVAFNGVPINTSEQLIAQVQAHPNALLTLTLLRKNERAGEGASVIRLNVALRPTLAQENTSATQRKAIGRIGVGFMYDEHVQTNYAVVHYPALTALGLAIEKTWDSAALSLKFLGKMLTGKMSWKTVSGPVGIAGIASQSAALGLKVYVGFLAFISISIGVFNLLPIPVLDGGHLMYYIAEMIQGRPLPEKVLRFGQQLGFGMLALLFSIAIYNDLSRLITASS